jgi:hypothetical protein
MDFTHYEVRINQTILNKPFTMTLYQTQPMQHFIITDAGELVVTPSPHSSKHDFDFFEGRWMIRNRKLASRLTNCDEWLEFEAYQEMNIILNGGGNIDNFLTEVDGQSFEGMTLRLFNPATRLWSIYWADTNRMTLDKPVQGSFYENIGYFYSQDQCNGKDVLVVFKWDARNTDEPVWSQAFSADNGKTWEWNWFMYMKKVD